MFCLDVPSDNDDAAPSLNNFIFSLLSGILMVYINPDKKYVYV